MNTQKTLIIIISVISISVITAMGATSAAYNIGSNLGCEKGLSVKVFDEETVPKYLIGSDYKAMPLDPRTTTIGATCQESGTRPKDFPPPYSKLDYRLTNMFL